MQGKSENVRGADFGDALKTVFFNLLTEIKTAVLLSYQIFLKEVENITDNDNT